MHHSQSTSTDKLSAVTRRSFTRRGIAAASITLALIGGAAMAPTAQALPGSSEPTISIPGAEMLSGSRVPGHYFQSPVAPKEQRDILPKALVGPSTPIAVGEGICTTAVSGYDSAGNKVAITAGHCGKAGDPVYSLDAPSAGRIGTYVRTGQPDYGVIKLDDDVVLTNHYGDVTITQLGGALPADNTQVCKTGITTGTTCGPKIRMEGPMIVAHMCGSNGDSGAPIYSDRRLVGIVNGGVGLLPSCLTPLQGEFHAPTAGADWNVIQRDLDAQGGVGAGFHLP
ncbi:S1 family peptidase [Corynebacterium anserum]|uniref:S1 family peptidase n=1 Tax=Corynebacterium anserum TaxID=2684406 RepID=UPI0021AFC7DA|nr:S1 family peptidase [Corynebacterium anserum]